LERAQLQGLIREKKNYVWFSFLDPEGVNILTLEAPVVLHYLKAPTAVNLTAVWFIAF
jgi:hypothetical protein